MKKVVLLAAAAALVVLASCKKDGTCTCKYDGEVAQVTKVEDQKYAKAQCEGTFNIKGGGDDAEYDENSTTCEWEK